MMVQKAQAQNEQDRARRLCLFLKQMVIEFEVKRTDGRERSNLLCMSLASVRNVMRY